MQALNTIRTVLQIEMKVEMLDVLAIVILISVGVLGYVLLSPTSVQQETNALSITSGAGGEAHFYLNITLHGGIREIPFRIDVVGFNAPGGWSYSIAERAFTVSSPDNFSDAIAISIPQAASQGSNGSLAFVLKASGGYGGTAISTAYLLSATASPSSFILKTGELLTTNLTGPGFVPWFAVVGPAALVTGTVGTWMTVRRRK